MRHLDGPALLARIYIGDADRHHGAPLYETIVAIVRERGIAGAGEQRDNEPSTGG